MCRQDFLRKLPADGLVKPRLRSVNGCLRVRQQMLHFARVNLATEVCTSVLVRRRPLRRRQAVVRHVLLIDDSAALSGEIHRREIS